MKILPRYILSEVLSYFALNIFIFTGLLLTVRILKLTSLIVNKGVSLEQVSLVFLSLIPTFLEIAIPLAALLGVMLTFARLSGDSEIVVIRASGISLGQLVRPIVCFGLFATAISLYVSHELKPWGFRKLSEVLFTIARTKSTAGLESGIFNELGSLTLYAEKVDPKTSHLTRIVIDDRSKEDSPRIITARSGVIYSNSEEQTITFHLEEGEIHEQEDGKYVLTRFITNDLVTDAEKLHSSDEEKRQLRTRELTWDEIRQERQELQNTIAVRKSEESSQILNPKGADDTLNQILPLSENGRGEEPLSTEELVTRERKLHFEQVSRFSLPVSALFLSLIGMALGIQSPRSQRTWGAGVSALIGLITFLAYFALYSFAKTLGEGGVVPIEIIGWMPNVVALICGFFFLRQVATERWQTISEGIGNALAGVIRFTTLQSVRRVQESG
ncbi:MAG: LptF/LptG family permease [Bdellovibrionales bacterium]|nr:LptF/LptG family permease [Bdellovibrionales bacterium]